MALCFHKGVAPCLGDVGGAKGKSAVEVYDPVTDTWMSKAPMPTARYGLDAVVDPRLKTQYASRNRQ